MHKVLVVNALLAVALTGCVRPAARGDARIAQAEATAAALIAAANAERTAAAVAPADADAAGATHAPAPTTTGASSPTATAAPATSSPTTAPRPPVAARATPIPPTATTAKSPPPAPRPTPTSTPVRRVAAAPPPPTRIERTVDAAGQGFTGANLRARATTKARLLTLIPNGAAVVVRTQPVRGEGGAAWFQARYGSRSGYVLGSLLGPPEVETSAAGSPEGEEPAVRARKPAHRRPAVHAQKPAQRRPGHRVTYRVTGAASPVKILYDDAADNQSEVTVRSLPWSKSFSVRGGYPYVFLVATSDTPHERELVCEILIDGKRVDKAAAEGSYYIAADCDSGE